jgi:hypothetical protein
MIIDFTTGAISQQPTALSMGVWNWSIVEGADVVVPDADPLGIEATFPDNRLHSTMPVNRLHYTLPDNRLHFTIPTED